MFYKSLLKGEPEREAGDTQSLLGSPTERSKAAIYSLISVP